MNLWRVFESAAVRKLAYLVVGFLFALLVHALAHAQTPSCFLWDGRNSAYGNLGEVASGASICAAAAAAQGSDGFGGTYSVQAVSKETATSAGDSTVCTLVDSKGHLNTQGFNAIGVSCPASCAGKPNMDILTAIAGNTGAVQGSMCVGGCEYTNSANTLVVGGPKATVYGQAVPSGNSCGASTGTQGNCASGGGTTTCFDDTTGKAVVNGETISKTDAPVVGDCVVYASGGSLCTYSAAKPLTTPPSPSADGTNVDTPQAVVSSGGATGGAAGTSSAYFSAAQNLASKNATTGTKTPGTGTGTGTTGTGLSAANGDCGASSVDCTGDATTPSLQRDDTIQSNTQTYLDAIKNSPLVVAITSIEQAFPDAACPSLPFTMFTKSVDLMPPACYVWSTYVSGPLSLVFLAIWAVLGIKIILSA